MDLIDLNYSPDQNYPNKLHKKMDSFDRLISELRTRNLPNEISSVINTAIHAVNHFHGSNDALLKQVQTAQSSILKLLASELDLTTKHHYRNQWMALGMAVFGIPFGLIFSMMLKNYAFLSIGLPIGIAIGLAIGTAKDKKAADEGKQLAVEIS